MKKLAILFFGAFVLSTSAQAAIYDFAAEGNRVEMGYEGFVTGVTNSNPMPVGLTISADIPEGIGDAFVYMDEKVGTKDGGMGVCGFINIDGQCKPSSDDAMVAGEFLDIESFGEDNLITHIKIRGDHAPVLEGVFLAYNAQGGDVVVDISGQNGLIWLALDTASSFLTFTIFGNEEGSIYLSALATNMNAVPVPAAVWLFGTAMFGLIGLRRKSKMEAVAA